MGGRGSTRLAMKYPEMFCSLFCQAGNVPRLLDVYDAKASGHLPTVRDFHQHLVKLNVEHTYIELEGLAHKRNEMMARIAPIWFGYHVESPRRAGGLPR